MSASYPVHVSAELELHLSRWRWLVKWILVLPHYVVLFFLWFAFAVLSVVAFFAVLITGRYPRSIFDFNVGVLRWSWRVSYYAYGALGTDRYPPFTLEDRADYPARLTVDHPEHLSRGLVLVKTWLLALPHYLVLGLFLGGVYAVGSGGDSVGAPIVASSGLISLLVAVAAVVLLFTGRYPRPVFDFVLGMQRWVLRVAAYAALMTDAYPPFRLDQGGADPGPAVLTVGSGPGRDPEREAAPDPAPGSSPGSSSAAPERDPGRRWGAGRVTALVAACVLAVASLGLVAAGLAGLVVDHGVRDADGFVMSGDERLTTDGFAVTSTDVDLRGGSDGPGVAAVVPDDLLGDARVRAEALDGSTVFVGIAPTTAVDRYLDGVAHATVTDLADGQPVYETSGGGAPASAPDTQDFWVASASGPGARTLTWTPVEGEWTAVVMRGDGAGGVDADVALGAELPALGWLAPLLLAVGVVALTGAVVVLVVVLRARTGPQPGDVSDGGDGGGDGDGDRPASGDDAVRAGPDRLPVE
jgi:hypothetical protein